MKSRAEQQREIQKVRVALSRLEKSVDAPDRSPGATAKLRSLADDVRSSAIRLCDAFALPSTGTWDGAVYRP